MPETATEFEPRVGQALWMATQCPQGQSPPARVSYTPTLTPGYIVGQVLDARTGDPLEGVTLWTEGYETGSFAEAVSDGLGRFQLGPLGADLYSANDVLPNEKDQGDEIDIELLGNAIYKGVPVGPPKGLWLNTFNNRNRNFADRTPLQRGRVYPGTSVAPIRLQDDWNTYTMRWFRDRAGFGVKWFADETTHEGGSRTRLVRAEPTGPYKRQTREAIPDQPMKVHLNIWAPGSAQLGGGQFPEALNSALKPTNNVSRVRKYSFEVLQVMVSRGTW